MSKEKPPGRTLEEIQNELTEEQKFNVSQERKELANEEEETRELAYRMAQDKQAKLEFGKEGDKMVSVKVMGLLGGKVLFYSRDMADIEYFLEIEVLKP